MSFILRMKNVLITIAIAFAIAAALLAGNVDAKRKSADPKHCEVCKKVIGDIIAKVKELPKKQQKSKND